MKKIGLLCLALVLALGAMGGALAYWNETLEIVGTVNTGELDVEFSYQKSNDDNEQLDPNQRGSWTFVNIMDPSTWTWAGTAPDRYAYDVGKTVCELIEDVDGPEVGDKQTMTITVTNAYPSYHSSVAFTIDNIGTIPVHIESIKLVEVSVNGSIIPVDVDLVACTVYWVDIDDATGTSATVEPWHLVPAGVPRDDEFSIHLSELEVCQEIEVDGALPGDISIHVMDGAEELTTYDFTILIVVTQFNAP